MNDKSLFQKTSLRGFGEGARLISERRRASNGSTDSSLTVIILVKFPFILCIDLEADHSDVSTLFKESVVCDGNLASSSFSLDL
jgi:hypothetical protein